jgi:hypothetical protein
MNPILRDIDITDVIDSIDPTEVEGDHVEVPANHEPLPFELDDLLHYSQWEQRTSIPSYDFHHQELSDD